MSKHQPLGQFVKNADLSDLERELVAASWQGSHRSFCFKSDFPVGAALIAENDAGDSKMFVGCNIENESFPATICAERNAAMSATGLGYRRFTHVAVVCRKHPGGAPCGLCRQVLRQFGPDAVLLNVFDRDSNVMRATVRDLLPAPVGSIEVYAGLHYTERQLVDRVLRQAALSYVPYSKKQRGAVACVGNGKGDKRRFAGTQIDNASYGGSMTAERAAVSAAVSAGFTKLSKIAIVGEDPIDGECLQVLGEFGGYDAEVIFVNPSDKSIVRTTVNQLFPDSFGPHSL